MNLNPFGPLGSVVGMGVQRLINEQEALKKRGKLKQVSDNSQAFIPGGNPLPLRGNPNKAINRKPNTPVGKIKLRGPTNKGKILESVLEQADKAKMDKKKKQGEDTTPAKSSTTGTSTTSTTTSTTLPSTTAAVGAKVKQQRIRDDLGSSSAIATTAANKAGYPIIPSQVNSTNNSYTSSSVDKTTSPNNMARNSKYSDKPSKGFGTPLDVTSAMGPSKYKDYNNPGTPEAVFAANKQDGAVRFEMMLPGTQHLNINEATDVNAPDFNGRLFINISSFADAMYNTDYLNLADYNDALGSCLDDAFFRLNKDVISNARSSVSSSWSQSKFTDTMTTICRAIETLACIDSILAYDPKQQNVYNRNDALDEYQKLFYRTEVLSARYNLARRLKSCWFPPDYAQLILWFYQNYRTSPLSQSAYYRYVNDGRFILHNPDGLVTEIGSVKALVSMIDSFTTALLGVDVQNISSILARIFPSGIIRGIPLSCSDAVFDKTHFEIYSNEPVLWRSPESTIEGQDWNVYPIVYGTTNDAGSVNNEIPYYMASDPSDKDGFAYVMQTVYSTSSASGYSIVPNTTTATNYLTRIEGIRSFTPWSTWGPASSITGVTQTIKNSNKWIYDHTANKFYPRCGNIPNALSGNDATSVIAYTTTSSTTWNVTPISRPNTAHQRTYFNNRKGPELNRRILVDNLFNLIG